MNSRFNFSEEEEIHQNLSPLSDGERFEERMRNLMTPIITYFELLNNDEFKNHPEYNRLLSDCQKSANESTNRINKILKG